MAYRATGAIAVNRRMSVSYLAAVAMLLIGMCLSLCLGASSLSPAAVWQALIQKDTGSTALHILVNVRLPRTLGAILAGSALAVSGAILQAVLHNPLASPNVIGVNSGAGLAVLLVSALWPESADVQPVAAFAGALLISLLVLALASRTAMSRLSVVLTGFAVGSMAGAGMNAVLIFYPDAYVGAGSFLSGGLSGLTLRGLRWPGVQIMLGLFLAPFLTKHMNILAQGELRASSLGMQVGAVKIMLLGLSAVLAGAAVSFAGLIGFVGLVAPHTARVLAGSDNRLVVPLGALLGAALVCICDTLSRMLFAPWELPVGIVLSLAGGPVFVYLILHDGRKHSD